MTDDATRSLIADTYAAAEKTLAQFGTKPVLLSLLTRVAILERQVLNLHDRTKSLESVHLANASAKNHNPDEVEPGLPEVGEPVPPAGS